MMHRLVQDEASELLKELEDFEYYLESCQNELLSSIGITRVAFIIRAMATMSDICHEKRNALIRN